MAKAKKVTKVIRLQIPAGKATGAPPVGTVLGPAGVNSADFCSKFNEATKDQMGDIVTAVINVYEDRSFDFEVKTPPAAFLIKKYAKVNKAGSHGQKEEAGSISLDDVKKIAEIKLKDLNAYDLDGAVEEIKGTAKNMGIKVVE